MGHTTETLRLALEKTSAALMAVNDDDNRVVKFTGVWSHLGTVRIGDILDEAEAALARCVSDGDPQGRDLGLGAKPASAVAKPDAMT